MSVLRPYTTEAKVEAFLNKSIVTGEADFPINAAVDIIEKRTDRVFYIPEVTSDDDTGEPSERLFDGNGRNKLRVDECVAVTKLEVSRDGWGDTFTEIVVGGANGYYKLPTNAAARLLPFSHLLLRSDTFQRGVQNIRVTAKWGYSADPPEAISLAATILAAGIYNYNRGGGGSNVKSESIGNYSVSYDNADGWDELDKAMKIIEQYRLISL
ncbi:MAG: hypothetical protein Q8Q08_12810 [Candidatus Omnitrophota bacterium]|nr:hypothetical protein [Candidatus Omnitrophota bacterium]